MMDKSIQWAISKIMDKVTKDYYGSVKINFNAGKVQLMEFNDTEKPPVDTNLKNP